MDLRREIALLLLGSVLGAGISLVIEAFSSHATSRTAWIYPLLLVVLVAVLVVRSLGPVRQLLASPGAFRLNGQWAGFFEYEREGEGQTVRIQERIVISQTGRQVRGRSISTSIQGDFPLPQASYRFDAVIQPDGIIEGTWKNNQVEHRYHGNFLGRVARSGDKIEGNWIGVEDPSARWGKFIWTRTT